MSEHTRKVLITPDPKHPDWYRAEGRDLLTALAGRGIGSIERTPGGIAYHREFADEIRTALTDQGYRLIDADARTTTTPGPTRGHASYNHVHYVSDEDNLTILPADTPGGHWQDESPSCPRCNPDHAPIAAQVRANILRTIRTAAAVPD